LNLPDLAKPDIRLTLDHCVKCNICVTACPVARVTDLFPGPKYVGPQAQRFRDDNQPTVDKSVDYCSGCGICDLYCPHGVKIQEINTKARAKLVSEDGIPLRNRILSRSEWLGRLAHPVAPLANVFFQMPFSRLIVEKVMGIHHRAPFPRFSWHTFRGWVKKQHSSRVYLSRQPTTLCQPGEKKVLYFHGCSTQYYEPWVGKAAIAVLEHNGFEVIIPEQNCCGLPLISQGDFDGARRYAYSNLRKLVPWVRQGYRIVGTSTSCILTLKHDYRRILNVQDEDARLVAEATWDIMEFLRDLHEHRELKTDFQPLPANMPYHAPCQLKAHGIGKPALDVLSLIPGFTPVDMDADCCGIAGTYGYKREKYEIAMAVGQPLFQSIRETGSDIAICDSETCRWQISHGAGVRAVHPIEVLAAAYGLYSLEK